MDEAATKAALLTLTGLSVAVAFRVGLFNIRARGWGALGAAFIGAHLELPSAVHVTRALVAAALGLGAARLRNRDRWSAAAIPRDEAAPRPPSRGFMA